MTATPILTENVAGPFSLTWSPAGSSPTSLGILGSKGINEIRQYGGEEIPSDLLGAGGAIDATHIGSKLFLEFDLEEANRYSVMLMSHPFNRPASADVAGVMGAEGTYGIPGLFFSDVFGTLIATPAFTNLNSAGQQATPVRTYGLCSLAPGFEARKLLSSRRKTVPIRLVCWPYFDSTLSTYVHYTKSVLP